MLLTVKSYFDIGFGLCLHLKDTLRKSYHKFAIKAQVAIDFPFGKWCKIRSVFLYLAAYGR